MNLTTRETFRTEIKSLTYHRRQAKARSRELSKEAAKLSRSIDFSGAFWKDPEWPKVNSFSSAALRLRHSKSWRARHTNIAYGLLRGVPYKSIESKCSVAPDPELVFELIKEMASWSDRKDFTVEKVKELLK